MSSRHVLTVAGWEFRRYFKWKDQLLGMAFFLVLGLGWMGVAALLERRGEPVTLAVSGLALSAPEGSRLRFVAAPQAAAAQSRALAEGTVHGVLGRRSDGGFELLVRKDPRYRRELETLLAETVRRERLAGAGMAPAELAWILAPPSLAVRFTDPSREAQGRGETIAAGVLVLLMLMTVFTAMAYMLSGITGEKQLRVTESVVAAIPPQAWIDGKILGITIYAVASVGNVVLGGLVVSGAAHLASGFTLPAAAVRPAVLATLVLFTALGTLLWNTFFAALAATIEDPNTSSRSALMLLPALPVALALVVLRDPDGLAARVLALFPLTSAPALPLRLVLSDPGAFEVALAALFLVATIWGLRRLASRIFEVGMLLYGKEPSWREVARWARARAGAVPPGRAPK